MATREGSTSDAGLLPVPRVRALVVDDEPALVRVVAAYLEREGFDVTAAEGNEALRLAREMRPDVVVLDWMMPGIVNDGRELSRYRRDRGLPSAAHVQ
jgi:CheY-like chemotaxis protein